jgi:hypothetical protein
LFLIKKVLQEVNITEFILRNLYMLKILKNEISNPAPIEAASSCGGVHHKRYSG